MSKFNKLAYSSPDEMIFGRSKNPIKCGFNVTIGNGVVIPEVNYTLPPMLVEPKNLNEVLSQYEEMVTSILSRLVTLDAPGVVLEFEHPPQMTALIDIGVKITEQTKRIMETFHQQHHLASALRVTICDIREAERPPKLRSGEVVPQVFQAFDENAKKGADMLSIESIGGKEVNDQALLSADVSGLLLALGILAPRDMHFLWKEICRISKQNHVVPAGDSACGFANTAMVLADKQYIPSVLAAVVRAMSAVRSLVAFDEGAIGPSKDCAYEGPVIKAITGFPISMEGKSAACAHFSHVGNIAAAVCDLWSNESVQNVKLLSGFAPEVFSEILTYDCRLMNQSTDRAAEKLYRDLMVQSDQYKSVHALIISPEASFEIAQGIVAENDDFHKTHRAGVVACQIIRRALAAKQLKLSDREINWLSRIEDELALYTSEAKVLEDTSLLYGNAYHAAEYGL